IIDSKLRKILKAKLWYKSKLNILNKNDTIKLLNINKLNNYLLKKKSITLVSNSHNIIPIKKTENVKFVVYSDIGKEANEFLNIFKFYASYNFYKLNFAKLKKIENKNDVYNIVLINQKLSDTVDNENITKVFTNFPIENTIFLNFSNYQNLRYFNKNQTIIQLSGNELTDFNLALQAIFGGIKIEGKLPYNISKNFNIENFNKTEKIRLSYTIPEEAEVNSEKLSEIDNIANEGISAGAFPGCQIFVAKDGKVIYNKSFGFQTYGKQNNVKWDDVYDLASVTKISATTIAAMKMIDQGKIKLNDKLAKFFKDKNIDYTRIKPDTVINIDTFFNNSIVNWKKFLKDRDTTNISDTSFISKEIVITRLTPKINIFKVQVIDLLKHKSGIVPALPIFRYIYYRKEYFKNLKIKISNLEVPYIEYVKMIAKNIPNTIDKNELLPDSIKLIIKNGLSDLYFKYFSNKKIKDTADIQIVDNLFLRNEFFDTIWRDTKQLPVYSRKVYQYSDINMILLQMAIDSVNRMSIDKYMKKQFFKPLSLKNISYSPLKYFSKNRIIPTENDDTWRFGLLKGYVHDPSASLLGGIAGNAGLYSNAHDLGVLFQMILNGGNYGKQQYIKQKTIEKFTKRFDDTQRALGFDMPNRKAIIGNLASKNTFGHSGYTGTCVWVDPDTKLVYVFLSNRNYTDSNNWRIVNYKIRERIHDAVYKAIVK
ncbi:MAG: serine hydrolase, partial [Bacteroidales bacterium]|nr:serine hydrolase [Bacteroidales bacterium]